MRRVLVITVATTAMVLGLVPAALAANQPSQGINSFDRNDNGFEGPHCHVLTVESTQSQWDAIVVYPSHKGHAASGLTHNFAADQNCNGVAGPA